MKIVNIKPFIPYFDRMFNDYCLMIDSYENDIEKEKPNTKEIFDILLQAYFNQTEHLKKENYEDFTEETDTGIETAEI